MAEEGKLNADAIKHTHIFLPSAPRAISLCPNVDAFPPDVNMMFLSMMSIYLPSSSTSKNRFESGRLNNRGRFVVSLDCSRAIQHQGAWIHGAKQCTILYHQYARQVQ